MAKNLTRSLEDYLEIIYIIRQNSGEVRVTDIAKALSFSKASVNRAVNILKLKNMVYQEKYGKIILTEKGEDLAKSVYEKHKILSDFFVRVLRVNGYTAETDACKAEHILSRETLLGMENFLKNHK